MLCEEVLRKIVEKLKLMKSSSLCRPWRKKADQSRTAKFCLNCLIKPVFIMMLFVRAEREAELGATFVCNCFNDAILLCRRTRQLCTIWVVLPEVHGKSPRGSREQI